MVLYVIVVGLCLMRLPWVHLFSMVVQLVYTIPYHIEFYYRIMVVQVTDAVPSSKEYYQMLQSVRCPSLRDDQLQEPYYLCTSSPPPGLNASYLVTLFTTVPEDTSKLDVFINSINVWSALGSSVRRVLFVAPLKQVG